ncbi:MAG: YkgJ family cysteine cluster protein [Bacillota bacterium]
MFTRFLEEYDEMVSSADKIFEKIGQECSEYIKCRRQCSDCCHAVFGLFLVEAAYINHQFNKLSRAEREEILLRAEKADKDLQQVQARLAEHSDDPQAQAYAMARERIRCPLLNDNEECALYAFRPITCRVYGVPVASRGKVQTCWKSGFKKGETYPTFNLDLVYANLYQLSKDLLTSSGETDLDRASLLVSVSKSLKTPIEELISGKLD